MNNIVYSVAPLWLRHTRRYVWLWLAPYAKHQYSVAPLWLRHTRRYVWLWLAPYAKHQYSVAPLWLRHTRRASGYGLRHTPDN